MYLFSDANSHLLGFARNREEELEFRGKLVLGVEAVGEVDAANTAVSVDLHAESLDVVRSVGTSGEVGQVELNLVPAFIEAHRHGADEGLDAGGALVVGRAESAAHILVVEDLHFEGEVFLQLHGQNRRRLRS